MFGKEGGVVVRIEGTTIVWATSKRNEFGLRAEEEGAIG